MQTSADQSMATMANEKLPTARENFFLARPDDDGLLAGVATDFTTTLLTACSHQSSISSSTLLFKALFSFCAWLGWSTAGAALCFEENAFTAECALAEEETTTSPFSSVSSSFRRFELVIGSAGKRLHGRACATAYPAYVSRMNQSNISRCLRTVFWCHI